jgi:hypothetical protein
MATVTMPPKKSGGDPQPGSPATRTSVLHETGSHDSTACDRGPLIPWPGFDVNHPSRVGAACRQINELLTDGDWQPWKSIQTLVAADHDLQPATVRNLLYGMVKVGGIERAGQYNRRFRRDHRKVRLAIGAG